MYASLVLKPKVSSGFRFAPQYPFVEKLDGERVHPVQDCSLTSRSGAGVVYYYALPPSIYFVKEIYSWRHGAQYFIEVLNGDYSKIPQSSIAETTIERHKERQW